MFQVISGESAISTLSQIQDKTFDRKRDSGSSCVDDTTSFRIAKRQTIEQMAHSLIYPLRRDRNIDLSLRNFLIRMVNDKCFSDRNRVTILIHPWSDTPRLLKIDSHAKHCVDCGNHAYYVVYEFTTLFAFRVCWKHLTDADREAIIDKYSIVN